MILDGHNSHVTLEVVVKAREAGLDLLTLPSHTLQPLDVFVFKPLKTTFRAYMDIWSCHTKVSLQGRRILLNEYH